MSDLFGQSSRRILIVHQDESVAAQIGDLIERCGMSWEHLDRGAPDNDLLSSGTWDAVFVTEVVFTGAKENGNLDIRQFLPVETVIVGIVESHLVDSPTMLGAGVDLILYTPLVLADVERALSFVEAIDCESREQSRDRLRKMNALHELAVASGQLSGSPHWISRLVEAGARVLEVDGLAMWSLDEQRGMLHCIAYHGLPEHYVREAEERSPNLVRVYTRIPQEISTHWLTPEDAGHQFALRAAEAAREVGIERVSWLPVRDSNRLYGHLSFYYMSEESASTYDLVLADAFSSIVAAWLGNFWLQSEIRRTNRLYRENVESSPDGVVVCHLDGTIERTNEAVEHITGYDRYELIDSTIFEWFVNPDDLPWQEWIHRPLDAPPEPVQVWLSRKEGERRRVSCYARRVQFPDPRTLMETETRIQIILQDITSQARRLVELELFHDLTRLISSRGSIEDAYELVVNRLYDYLNYRLVAIGHVVGRQRMYLRAYRTHMEGIEIPKSLDVGEGITGLAVRENRSVLVQDVSQSEEYYGIDDEILSEMATVIRRDGEPVGILDVMTDATQPLDEGDLQLIESIASHLGLLIEQVTVQERLERQALTDPLTGMANRRAFMQHLNALVANPESPQSSLLLVELDHFKSVNDRFGHLFGDEMLKQVAKRLHTKLRDGDLLSRYGGDEIAIIFRDISPAETREIANCLRDVIDNEPFTHNGTTVTLTVSIGIALFPYHGRTTDELIGEADRAMYLAKLEGRNSVQGDLPIAE